MDNIMSLLALLIFILLIFPIVIHYQSTKNTVMVIMLFVPFLEPKDSLLIYTGFAGIIMC